MDEEAENGANYVITQENVNSEAGYLGVVSARFLGADRTAVELTTRSQNEVSYRVTVTNVADTFGQKLKVTTGTTVVLTSNTALFAGTAPNADTLVDSDGDGLYDNQEQAGYVVVVELANGLLVEREVTSDPDRADTDGDGITDSVEFQYGMNPRSSDTDGDRLSDDLELNTVFSNPFVQDTDGDGLDDGFEHFDLGTSPLLADTDGDKLDDFMELFQLNRDPFVADLPQVGITVGEVGLRIDERFTYTDEQGETVSQESNTSTELEKSENTSFARTDGSVAEIVAGAEAGFEAGNASAFGAEVVGGAAKAVASASFQYTDTTSWQTDQGSAAESRSAYEESLTKGSEFSSTSAVTREVVGARIDVEVSIANQGTVPFTVSNLEITVLQRSPIDSRRFLPVATLVSGSELATGAPFTVNLGPFQDEQGPFLFSNREIFPGLVESLMQDPKGLIFRVANYDITDELGRNFTFSNQTANDRTAGIILDYGDAEASVDYRVATSGALDNKGFGTGGYVGGFDSNGKARGLSLDFLLQERLGLKRYDNSLERISAGSDNTLDTTPQGDDVLVTDAQGLPSSIDAGANGWLDSPVSDNDILENADTETGIIAGPDKTADSIAQGDDVQLIPFATTGLSIGTPVIGAGDNGVLDTSPQNDDLQEFITGYEVGRTCNQFSDNAREVCRTDADCDASPQSTEPVQCNGPEVLTRVGTMRNGDFSRAWVILTSANLPAGADFGSITVRPGESLALAFLQDLDEDGLFARTEFLEGSIDSSADRYVNAEFGVDFDAGAANECVDCDGEADSKDTDRDGLGDYAEVRVGWQVNVDGGGLRRVYPNPGLRDTDGDGLLDPEEQDLSDKCEDGDYRKDGLCAFFESPSVDVARTEAIGIIAGSDGQVSSVAGDTNGDGLVDDNDSASDDVSSVDPTGDYGFTRVVIEAGPNGKIETALGSGGDDRYISASFLPPATDPSVADTDLDGISDAAEVNGYECCLSIREAEEFFTGLVYSPFQANTRANGDDIQKVPYGQPTEAGTIVILPGPNGKLDSTPEGTELSSSGIYVASAPNIGSDTQRYVTEVVSRAITVKTDPLRRDSDNDTITEGREIAIGANPTVEDGDLFRDSDRDGLSDSEEDSLGWLVFANEGPAQTVNSSPSLVDTDRDGLPDLIERELRTNPNLDDTDGDGISDFDEVSDFERFVRVAAPFPALSINGSTSERYGTDPLMADTDGDGLSDYKELIEGFRMLFPGESGPRTVFTNPNQLDSDLDGLPDKEEIDLGTDPNLADTDGDNRSDGDEVDNSTDPLSPDLRVVIEFVRLNINELEGDADGTGEFGIWLTATGPQDLSPEFVLDARNVQTQAAITRDGTGEACYFVELDNDNLYTFPLDKLVPDLVLPDGTIVPLFGPLPAKIERTLKPGEALYLDGLAGEFDFNTGISENCGLAPFYIPDRLFSVQNCAVSFNETFRYEDLVTSNSEAPRSNKLEFTGTGCDFDVRYNLRVE